MQTFFWVVGQLFNFRKSEQERLEWHWFWHVDMVAWWSDLAIVKSAQHYMHPTLALVRRNQGSSEDELPF